jgi:hypothetical protein
LQKTTWRAGPITPPSDLSSSSNSIGSGDTRETFTELPPEIARRVEEISIAVQHDVGSGQYFRPSFAAMQRMGYPGIADARPSGTNANYTGSNNYKGDITLPHNQSANIPDNQNCSLWIIGLPANVTHNMLLRAIRNVGRIYACVINPAVGNHKTSAAKIVFFERYEAENMFNRIKNGIFVVGDKRICDVRWNKIKTGRFPYPEQSRVIRVTGPEEIMYFHFFDVFFGPKFTYELDWRGEVESSMPGMVTHEWRFGSLRSQAASAKKAIETEMSNSYWVEWAKDPCAGS